MGGSGYRIFENEGDSIIKQWGNKEQFYCNYKNPIQINDSTILALKTSMYKSQSLVKITNDKEEHLLYVPYLLHSYFDYKDGHILYAQYSPSIRWQQESAADIIEYDLNTKNTAASHQRQLFSHLSSTLWTLS